MWQPICVHIFDAILRVYQSNTVSYLFAPIASHDFTLSTIFFSNTMRAVAMRGVSTSIYI
jgi:hypothetical protein